MPQIGRPAPDFALPNQDGKTIRLSDYRGRKVVLFAFPKADSMGCNIQACSFRDEFPRFEGDEIVVLGISADTPEDLRQWKQSKNLPYDLLSDPDHKVLEPWGACGYSFLGLHIKMMRRAQWVIDENGILIDQNLNVLPNNSVSKALDAVSEKHIRV